MGCSWSALTFRLIILRVIGAYKPHHAINVAALGGATLSLRKPEIDITAAKLEAATYRAIEELDKKFR